jgi:aminoglycoside phosphotransferase (APT) family kinase protein
MQRPFVDQPVTDLGVAGRVAAEAAAYWGLGEPDLLRAGMNAIYRAGDVVLRVSAPSVPAVASIELAEMLLGCGLAVTRPVRSDVVESSGLSATAWEHMESTGAPIDWHAVGRLVRRTHEIEPSELPTGYPLPRPDDFPWWNFPALLDDVSNVLDDAARRGLVAAIERWPDWADASGAVVCHGDVHPGNVIMAERGPVLIDWDLLCSAPAGWDHAPMMTWHTRWGGPASWYSDFATGYGRSMIGDPSAEAFAELRLVAATLMRLKAAMRNEAAMPEAMRRLAYWRGESDAPAWQAQ